MIPSATPSALRKSAAILLDAGWVLGLSEPDRLLPPLAEGRRRPRPGHAGEGPLPGDGDPGRRGLPGRCGNPGGRNYLLGYVAACGVGQDRAELLATEMAQGIRGHGWAHVGLGAMDGLRAVAALGLPMGVVSNSDGSVGGRPAPPRRLLRTRRLPPGRSRRRSRDGRHPRLRRGRRGQARPGIFRLALDALGVPAGRTVLHVGDSLRYDVAGALAAGLPPVHMDPYGFCPAPDGHPHVRSFAELAGRYRPPGLPARGLPRPP